MMRSTVQLKETTSMTGTTGMEKGMGWFNKYGGITVAVGGLITAVGGVGLAVGKLLGEILKHKTKSRVMITN